MLWWLGFAMISVALGLQSLRSPAGLLFVFVDVFVFVCCVALFDLAGMLRHGKSDTSE